MAPILTFTKMSALRALRVFRQERRTLSEDRCDPPVPDASPRKRWTASIIPYARLALESPPSADAPVDVIVPRQECRLRGPYVRCSVRSTSLPPNSFVPLGDGIYIPCPELLFLEMADVMSPVAHALLGFELCGTYARSPRDPRLGEVAYGMEPVTSVERIGRYLDAMGPRRQVLVARLALSHVADNAWSPIEAIIALLVRLPVHELGYELGEVDLNVRHESPSSLVSLGCKGSRVPDIEVRGTHVGFNYDSGSHFDLRRVADSASSEESGMVINEVREKYLDDIRRNRELAAQGRVILPVTQEDLFARQGLDAVMLEAAMAIDELDGGGALSNVKVALRPNSASKRQRLIWALLPWPQGVGYARELRLDKPW